MRAGKHIAVIGLVMECMREVFDNKDRMPLGGLTGPPEHRGGLLVAIDGFNERGGESDCASLAFVNVLKRYRADNFPNEAGASTNCKGTKAVVIQVGVARCSVALDEHGEPPSRDVTEREALVLQDDADRLDQALCMAVTRGEDKDLISQAIINSWEPVGPEGGILTGVQTITIELA